MVTISWTLLLSLLFGVLGSPTLGVPPRPEDPALLRAAPKTTLVYVEWAGSSVPDPNSANLTERLAAEPEVRALRKRVLAAIRTGMSRGLRGQRLARARKILGLGVELFRRPGCAFLSDINPKESSVSGGLVVNLGARAGAALSTIGELLEGLPPGMLSLSPSVSGKYLIVGFGTVSCDDVARRLRGHGKGLSGNPAFARHHAAVRVERLTCRSFIDTGALLGLTRGMPPQVGRMLAALGLDKIEAIVSESGLEGSGFVSRTHVAMSEKTGLLSLLDAAGLTNTDLGTIPADSSLALAARVEPQRIWNTLLDVVGRFDPRARGQMQRHFAEDMQRFTGVRFVEDLLAHCGNTLTVWNSPSQGGLFYTGTTVALSLEDAPKFGAAFAKLMAKIAETQRPRHRLNGRMRRGTYLAETKIGPYKGWWVSSIGEDFPFAPTWCVTDTHLLFSLFPQALRSAVRRGATPQTSLATAHPELLPADTMAMCFVDVRRLFDTAYPMLQVFGQVLCGHLQREGLPIDITALPSAESLRPHLSHNTCVLRNVETGIHIERHGTLPFSDPVLGALLPATAGIVGYRAKTRMMHRRVLIERKRREQREAR